MKILNIWHHPVVSGVISSGISLLLWPCVLGDIQKIETPLAWHSMLVAYGTPNWMLMASTSVALGLIVFIIRKWRGSKDRECLSSKEWFSLINQKLNDCTSARIYLRRFDHPDDFRNEHKDALMQIMRTIKARVAADADIRIISYNDNGCKTGFDWLCAELNEKGVVEGHIKIVPTQLTTNSSSMYLFDDKSVIFNRHAGKLMKYYCENHASSIIFEFIKGGFNGYWKGI